MVKKKAKIIGFLALGVAIVVGLCFLFVSTASKNHSDVMRRANSGNPNFGNSKVYDIGMLASHDALSDKISSSSIFDYSSNVPELAGLENTKLVKSVAANYARAQSESLSTQLNAGVRYIDARITCMKGTFYTTHSLISAQLEIYLKDLITFLLNNPGEFVVFDINYYSTKEKNATQLAEYMQTVKVRRDGRDYNIYDFINYDTSKDFTQVTYNDVTSNGTKGGLIILPTDLGEVRNSSLSKYFKSKTRINNWYNEADSKSLLAEVDEVVNKNKNKVGFKCNQLQTTPDAKKIIFSLWGSLLDDAETHNIKAIENSHFDYWISCMPIVWFDNVTCNKNDFNSRVNDKILNYNLSLNKSSLTLKYNKLTSSSQLKDGMKIMIKEVGGTNGYYGNDYKPGNIGSYVGNQFVMKDKNMWTLKKSGDSWKIRRPDGYWLYRNWIGDLDTTKKEGSAVTFKFDFTNSGTAKIHYDKYYMYLTGKRALDLSKKYSDEFEIYA